MQMTERRVGSVTILDLTGAMTIGEPAIRLRDRINSLITQGRTSVLLNLAEVSCIDGGGLGQLVASYTALAGIEGGQLKLLHVKEENRDLLSITGLARFFEVFDQETDALSSFAQQSLPSNEALCR